MEHGFAWPGQIQGAVSLTYDDALQVHHTLVAPLLRRYNLRATFYPTIWNDKSDLSIHPEHWRELAAAGHELGNHSVFHPCRQDEAHPYAWLDDRYDLRRYTPEHLRAEFEVANLVLYLLDGQAERTYAYTCNDTTIGTNADEQPIAPLLADLFIAARGTLTNRVAQPAEGLDLYDIGCIDVTGRSLEDLKSIAEDARATGGWAVLMIHGIGAGTHELYLDVHVHERFIHWLAQEQTIWTAPIRTVARYIQEQRTQGSESLK